MGPMTHRRTVEYPVRLACGHFAYIWAESDLTPDQVKTVGKCMGLDVVQVSAPRKTTLR